MLLNGLFFFSPVIVLPPPRPMTLKKEADNKDINFSDPGLTYNPLPFFLILVILFQNVFQLK